MSFGFVLENIIFKVVLFEQKNLFMSKHHSIFALYMSKSNGVLA